MRTGDVFPLEHLAGLRELIFEYLVTHPDNMDVTISRSKEVARGRVPPLFRSGVPQLPGNAILGTNWRLTEEATVILYKSNDLRCCQTIEIG